MPNLPETMNCIEIAEPGGAEMLRPVQCPVPVPGPGEVLIRVQAAGVNRPDVLQRQGRYAPPPEASPLPGLEVAGTVFGKHPKTAGCELGEEVCALVPGGGYAQYVVCPAAHCLPIPKGFSMVEAAALPETFFTVWSNVFERGALKPKETFLVHGGSSGIGTTAIQLAHHMDVTVLATAGSDEKCRACTELGADLAINYKAQDFVAEAKTFTEGRGVDVILDMVGGDYVARNIKALAYEGRLINIAFLAGSKVHIDLMPMMLKRLSLAGSTLRPQSNARKAQIAQALKDKVWPLMEAGKIRPLIHTRFSLEDARKAHELMESGAHIGKIVLDLDAA